MIEAAKSKILDFLEITILSQLEEVGTVHKGWRIKMLAKK